MPAVTAIAAAPQARTRTIARRGGAPPSRAPTSPSSPSASSVTTTVTPTRADAGVTATASNGSAAPAENESADVHAAWNGRARRASSRPSSSRACARSAPPRDSAVATSLRQRRRQAPLLVDAGELAQLAGRVAAELARFQAHVGPLGVALRADRHVLPGGHRQRACHQPGDARDDDRAARRAGRGHAEHEARGRHDAVVGAEHRGAQPVRAVAEMDLGTGRRRTHAQPTVLPASAGSASGV